MRAGGASTIVAIVVALSSASCSDESSGATGSSGGTAGAGAGGGGAAGTGGATGGSAGQPATGGAPGCPGFAPPPQASGKTYWVSPVGSDANPGTEAQPFETIQKGVDAVGPGDTVVVKDGIYTGAPGEPVVSLTKGGTAESWVWLKAENKWGAKIDGQGTASEGIALTNDIGWVRVEGFEIHDVAIDGSASGITAYSGGHDSAIVGNHIHHIGRLCTDTSNGLDAIFIQQPRVTIEANLIHDIGRFGPGEQGCTPGNEYWKNHDHGVYVDGDPPGASGAVIRNNVFYNHARGWAIQLYPGTLDDVTIVHNTFAFPNPNRDGHIVIDATLANLRIQNNLFFQPTSSALNTYGGPTLSSAVVESNLTDAAEMLNSPTPSGMTLAKNLTGADPKLVDPTAFDFHLGPGSPAIDQGTADAGVKLDFDGCPRPVGSGLDIGADEATP